MLSNGVLITFLFLVLNLQRYKFPNFTEKSHFLHKKNKKQNFKTQNASDCLRDTLPFVFLCSFLYCSVLCHQLTQLLLSQINWTLNLSISLLFCVCVCVCVCLYAIACVCFQCESKMSQKMRNAKKKCVYISTKRTQIRSL